MQRGERTTAEPSPVAAQARTAGIADGHRRDDGRPDEVVIGLLADPDLPAILADELYDALPGLLREAVDEPVTWTVRTVHDPFEATHPEQGGLMAKGRERARKTEWDLVICLTDEPIQEESSVVVASVDADDQVAVASLPALGGVLLRHRLRAVVVPIIACLVARSDDPHHPRLHTELRRRLATRGIRVRDPEPGSAEVFVVRTGRSSTLHLLAGMVRANRPWRLLLGLSTALAGALAGIVFGVLYSSIWTLGTSLGPLRLAGLTVAAITAMTIWLVIGHRLWERPHRTADGRTVPLGLRNASTLLTVAIGTIAFFLAILALALAAVALVIPPTYLADTLGHPVGVSDYLSIALMATVLGTLAGAVGSGLEDDTAVREATYGYREQERRHRAERETDNHTTPTRRSGRQ